LRLPGPTIAQDIADGRPWHRPAEITTTPCRPQLDVRVTVRLYHVYSPLEPGRSWVSSAYSKAAGRDACLGFDDHATVWAVHNPDLDIVQPGWDRNPPNFSGREEARIVGDDPGCYVGLEIDL
jgi:hypothetical protein